MDTTTPDAAVFLLIDNLDAVTREIDRLDDLCAQSRRCGRKEEARRVDLNNVACDRQIALAWQIAYAHVVTPAGHFAKLKVIEWLSREVLDEETMREMA